MGGGQASTLVSSDRFLLKVLDQTLSLQDFQYQSRNLKALSCVFEDAFIVEYFGKAFIKEWALFLEKFPTADQEVSKYLSDRAELLKKIRYFFKVLRYSEDQKMVVTPQITELMRKGTKERRCDKEILYKDSLKTNFLALLRLELYFRSRYGGQLNHTTQKFSTVRPSIDLFIESLDKQFSHEYFW
jgi:hypothetical protein